MRTGISLLLCLIAIIPGRSQTFETTMSGYFYNPEYPGNSIITGEGGDFFVAGKTRAIDGLNALVLSRYSSTGALISTNSYETGEYVNYHVSLYHTHDGGYLLSAAGPYTIRLIRTNDMGGRLWTRSINTGRYEDKNPLLLQTDSTDFVVFGTRVRGPEDNYLRYISFERVDTGGIISSAKEIRDVKHLSLQSVIKTASKDYLITGYTGFPYPEGSMLYVCRIDDRGDTLWARVFDELINIRNSRAHEISNKQFIITGTHTSKVSLRDRIFFLWLDKDGNRIMFLELPGDFNRAYNVIQTVDNGFAFVGSTASMGNGQEDLLIIKTNILGQTEWISTFGGARSDIGYDIKQMPDSGYVAVGSTESYSGSSTHLLKTNKNGDVSCRLDHNMFFEPVIHSVSTDINSEKVVVSYEPVFGDSKILLYKETALPGSFILVNRKSVNQSGIIYDSTAISSLRSYNYKIHVINECGDTSLPSRTHGTIYLEAFAGENTRNLFWNQYLGAEVETFEILRGTSKDNMTALNWVPGHITNFSDTDPPEGTVHYRIKGIIKNNESEGSGSYTTYSNIASLIGVHADNARSVYLAVTPNPVRTMARISFPNEGADAYVFSLYELTGRLVCRSFAITGSSFEFDRSGIASGIYLMVLQGKETFRSRLVIE